MNILAIETSCDETACAIVEDGVKVLGSVIASSTQMHEKYGGIVPEVASREQLRCILPTMLEALEPLETHETFQPSYANEVIKRHIDAIAVTVGPGLIGSLLVGVETAKTIAFATGKPIIPVNHVLAHTYANFINSQTIAFPAISLVVSGGHTELYVMRTVKDLQWLGGTLDDAAGEAFDKTARLLGFGSRGGLAIQETASQVKIENCKLKINLPRPMIHDDSLNFSFSGLKTAIIREWNNHKTHSQEFIVGMAHEVQEAITDVLVEKTLRAAKQHNAKSILLSGGVAANIRLREKFSSKLKTLSAKFFAPPTALCTDNAVYIAGYAYFRGVPADWHTITAVPDLSVEIKYYGNAS